MSGFFSGIVSWFKGEPKLTVAGIVEDANKITNVSDIKPEKFEDSSSLELDNIMVVDSMKTEYIDLNLDTIETSDEDKSDDNTNDNTNDIKIQKVGDENTEVMIQHMLDEITETEKQTGGCNYKRRYNKRVRKIRGGDSDYCGKINKQEFDNSPVNVGKY